MPTDTEMDIKYSKPYIITEIQSETCSYESISSETSDNVTEGLPYSESWSECSKRSGA